MPNPFIVPKTDTVKDIYAEPKPLTRKQKRRLEMQRAERAKAITPESLNRLASRFGPRHPVSHGQKAAEPQPQPVNNGWGKETLGERVDWAKQNQDTSQRSAGGKRKKESGKK